MSHHAPLLGFHSRAVFSFVIPEVISSEGKVRKPFRQARLVSRLEDFEPLGEVFPDFGDVHPICDLRREDPEYVDHFWAKFWAGRVASLPSHFPFVMKYKSKVSRSVDWKRMGDGRSSSLALRKYSSIVSARLYPYGAISIHIIEHVEFTENCSFGEIVDFLSQLMSVNSETLTLGGFLQTLRRRILDTIVEKPGRFLSERLRPQYHIINPIVETVPDLGNTWKDISALLAMSRKEEHVSKYDRPTYDSNYGKEKQLILISPFSCVLFTPNLKHKKNARKCLRKRISSVAELVAIQQAYVNMFKQDYDRILQWRQSRVGHPFREAAEFLKARLGHSAIGNELTAVQAILNFHQYLRDPEHPRWFNWYAAIKERKMQGLQNFIYTLEKLDAEDIKLGEDVRGSIRSTIGVAKDLEGLVSIPTVR